MASGSDAAHWNDKGFFIDKNIDVDDNIEWVRFVEML